MSSVGSAVVVKVKRVPAVLCFMVTAPTIALSEAMATHAANPTVSSCSGTGFSPR